MTLSIKLLLFWLNATTAFAFAPGQHQVASTSSRRPSVGRQLVQMRATTSSPYGKDVTFLLKANRDSIDSLASISADVPELTLLRFALAFPSLFEAKRALRDTVAWRSGAGQSIVNSAAEAVAKATVGGGWDNEPVRDAAPHAAAINRYITTNNILTLSSDSGNLVYVIRASAINDRELMSKVSVSQLVDFFLYVKEVHSLVANARSERTGKLCGVIFANDISGVRAIPDRRFSEALTASSQQYEKLYPSMAGPTMILNLPFVLQAFVGLIKPLFPRSVQGRLMFEKAPVLASLKELSPLTTNSNTRKSFLEEVKRLQLKIKTLTY
jgi:hypothetical protein|uniref:CRAL-TRIO domain-containing protein n=1 Tax=Attheya septentrionalis TaxID=420275 RepID=A0A6T7G1E4_9STRA|mmetsp:Transcript_16482/g.29983  ORF Transcript_16482/g.29983 Transcript_16482/m.29983 type:complete len:326 (+) Transcript_16482:98-1075(+)